MDWFGLVFFVFICLKKVYSQTSIGDFCILDRTKETGVCQLLEKCAPAIQALKTGVYPQTCGFQSNQPIVCCVGDVQVTPSKPPTPSSPTTKKIVPSQTTKRITNPRPLTSVGPKNPTLPKVGDRSKQKCVEYGKFVNIVVKPPVNIPGVKPYLQADCGIVEVPLIVGGEIAKPKEFPHMALIGFVDKNNNNEKKWICGGSLVSEDFILTAAHCLYSKQYGDPKYIRLGDLDTRSNNDDAKPQEYNIKRMIKHHEYKPPSQYHDIALIQMEKKAKLNPYVRPICLNTDTKLTTKRAIASGWGQVGYTSDLSDALRKVTLELFSSADCNNTYKSNGKLKNGIDPKTQMCAGSRNEAKDTCQGDSGGPLQVYNGKQVYCTYRIVGITSFGKGCGVYIPGVYTMVSEYIQWIENIVWT